MKFMRLIVVTTFVVSISTYAISQSAARLDGQWIVTWGGNSSQNAISLHSNGVDLSGDYTNDHGTKCSISGKLVEQKNEVTLLVSCPTWQIQMDGMAAADGKSIAGSYVAAGGAGAFMMAKQ